MTAPSPTTCGHDRELPISSEYLDRLMRRNSFEALWPLFAHAQRPAKELTESFSALVHLRPLLPAAEPFRVLHVGDGAHARTAALFALKSAGEHVSIDPLINLRLVVRWQEQFGIERLTLQQARLEDVAEALNALPPMPTFVTFVHAHVSVDDALARLRWDAAFTLACCVPGKQLTKRHRVATSGVDENVLSTGRDYQVLVNDRASAPPR